MSADKLPVWAQAYALYDRHAPLHRGRRHVLSVIAAVGRRNNEPIQIKLKNGNRILVSPDEGAVVNQTVGMCCLREREFEPRVEQAINELLKPGNTVLDVGANIGYMTSVMAARVGPTGHVVAFEPVPSTVALLRRTIALNGHEHRVEIVTAAVGDQPGELPLLFDPRLPGNASFHHAETLQSQPFNVPIVTIDSQGVEPTFIKIDVEGHEMAVFRGAEQTIRRAKPTIVFEYNPRVSAGWTLSDAAGLLREWAPYTFFRLTDRGRESIDSLDKLSGFEFGDVLAIVDPRS